MSTTKTTLKIGDKVIHNGHLKRGNKLYPITREGVVVFVDAPKYSVHFVDNSRGIFPEDQLTKVRAKLVIPNNTEVEVDND